MIGAGRFGAQSSSPMLIEDHRRTMDSITTESPKSKRAATIQQAWEQACETYLTGSTTEEWKFIKDTLKDPQEVLYLVIEKWVQYPLLSSKAPTSESPRFVGSSLLVSSKQHLQGHTSGPSTNFSTAKPRAEFLFGLPPLSTNQTGQRSIIGRTCNKNRILGTWNAGFTEITSVEFGNEGTSGNVGYRLLGVFRVCPFDEILCCTSFSFAVGVEDCFDFEAYVVVFDVKSCSRTGKSVKRNRS
jgi:hypothetical protein